MADYLLFAPGLIVFMIIFAAPISLENLNKKRAAKNKPGLTEAEYQRKIKKERIIAAIILGASYILAALIRNTLLKIGL